MLLHENSYVPAEKNLTSISTHRLSTNKAVTKAAIPSLCGLTILVINVF
jgi:hypothetical protein